MTASRMLWVITLGTVVALAAIAVPVGAFWMGHGTLSPSHHGQGPPPTWGNNSTTYAVTFSETGLPNGTSWSVHVSGGWWATPLAGGLSPSVRTAWHRGGFNSSNTSTIGFALPNGSYRFHVGDAFGNGTIYAATPSHGEVTVNGSAVSVNVSFSLLTFSNLTFTETGLPNDTCWSVALYGGNGGAWPGSDVPAWGCGRGGSSTEDSITFTVASGNYSFSVPDASANGTVYVPTPASGNVTTNASDVTVAIAFAPLTYYTVSFTESGLPAGTNWSVALFGASTFEPGAAPGCGYGGFNSSSNATITFTVPDGTYGFEIGNVSTNTTLYVPSPASGNVTVNGSDASVAVTFSPLTLYNVTFSESGLPNGTFWFVHLGDGAWNGFGNGSNASAISFALPNGSYNFTVGAWGESTLLVPSPANGTVTVDGASVSVSITFSAPVLYTVTFEETGLPNGSTWFVSVGGWFSEANASNGTSVSFELPNGTFGFAVGSVWVGNNSTNSSGWTVYTPDPDCGTVTVDGSDVVVDVTYSS